MARRWLNIGILMALALIAACATPGPRTGTEVTRFHLNEPIAPQAITLEPAEAADEESLAFRTYESVVADELARLGFQRVEGEESALIGVVEVTRTSQVQAPERSPFSISLGGGSYGGSGGAGVGASTDVGGSEGGQVTVTELEVRLINRAGNNVIWEGRATHIAEPGMENRPIATVQMLAQALFQDFPGESGKTVSLP